MDKTEINATVQSQGTVINPGVAPSGTETVINPISQNQGQVVPPGTVLADKYIVEAPLTTASGEANLYTCTYRNRTYIAKVYRRQSAIKDDIAVALTTVSSPYVAKLYATGTWNGMPFEILPYYQAGSLAGKRFSFVQLKEDVIPALNAGLNVLHKANIIHKDLKPSNIMLGDDGKTVAIIDFGISSIREGGNTVVVTKTGMTPEYSAPETFRNLFLEESDYYSLGVTIYELFCGHTPYTGMDRDTIEQFVSVQKIPFTEDFPTELKHLITGLTYSDITNRRDKNNPNRRWTYDEVRRWCKGEYVPVPGGSGGVTIVDPDDALPKPFTFMYAKYTSLSELTEALALDWGNGKKRLYRSLLTDYFRGFNQELASYCMDAVEAANRGGSKMDTEYFRLLYRLKPTMQGFHWLDWHYSTMQQLGTESLAGLRENDYETIKRLDIFLKNGLFSSRAKIVEPKNVEKGRQLAAIEQRYMLAKGENDEVGQQEQMFLIAFLYAGTTELRLSGISHTSFDSFAGEVKQLIQSSPDALDDFAKKLIIAPKGRNRAPLRLVPQFSAWLYAQGLGSEVETWQKRQTSEGST